MDKKDQYIDELQDKIKELEIQIKHLSNELKLTKQEYEDSTKNYFDIHCHMEQVIQQRTARANELREKIIQNQKMEAMGMLAGGVAHDLNNILTGIICYPEILLRKFHHNSSEYKIMDAVIKSGKRAAQIIDDMLTMARRGVKKEQIFSLNTVIEEFFESPEYAHLLQRYTHVRIDRSLQKDMLNIKGSCARIMKMITNLVYNAAEALNDSGEIFLSTEQCELTEPLPGYNTINEGIYVCLSIKDNGSGISDEHIEHIFEPFYTTKIMGKSGTGLGLAVVSGVVHDMNGYVVVESKLDFGTLFKLYFPATEQAADIREYIGDINDHIGDHEKILVVDDDEQQRLLVVEILRELNYDVTAVKDGVTAVEYIRHHTVDLVMLDMIMEPSIDGLETYKRILHINPDQKALVMSGFSKTEKVKQALALGVGQYIQKPFSIYDLARSIKKELKRMEQKNPRRNKT